MTEKEAWTGEIVKLLHVNGITQTALADKMGVTKEYVSMLLHGKRVASGAEGRMRSAIEELIKSEEK